MRTENSMQINVKATLAIIIRVSLLSIVLMLSGCLVGPNYDAPQVKVNDNWNEQNDSRVTTQGAIDSRWWTVFNDLTLDQLVELAYKQNLPLQIAGLRILESRARLGIAIGQQYPQQQDVFGSATAVGLSKNSALSITGERNFGDYQLGFDAAWELDFWGKFRRNVQAARANLFASVADYDNAIVSLTAEVARNYILIRTNEVFIGLTLANIKIQEQGLHIAQSRFRNGVTTELDVVQAQSLLESTKASLPELQTNLKQAQNAMSTLLGQPTGAVEAILREPNGIPTAAPEVAVGLPAQLLRRRPDVRSAELSAIAASAQIGIAKADLYPAFSLLGEIGFQTSSNSRVGADVGNIFDGDSLFYSFGPGFRWPVFNYGRIKNSVRVRDSIFQQQLVNYQNVVLLAAQEVEDVLTGFLRAQETAAFRANSVKAAQRSVEIAMVQYREGAVDYQRVLDTQRSLLEEEISLAEAHSSIATNLTALYKALGGGWEVRQGQPVVDQSTQVQMQERTDWGCYLPLPQLPENLNAQPVSIPDR